MQWKVLFKWIGLTYLSFICLGFIGLIFGWIGIFNFLSGHLFEIIMVFLMIVVIPLIIGFLSKLNYKEYLIGSIILVLVSWVIHIMVGIVVKNISMRKIFFSLFKISPSIEIAEITCKGALANPLPNKIFEICPLQRLYEISPILGYFVVFSIPIVVIFGFYVIGSKINRKYTILVFLLIMIANTLFLY